jgi:hypothetical protein
VAELREQLADGLAALKVGDVPTSATSWAP